MTLDIDLQPLLDTMHKITSGRILNQALLCTENDFNKAQVPVLEINPGDKTDSVLRRYAKDWVKRKLEDVSVEVRYEKLPSGTSYFGDKGEEVPVTGSINITWWPRKQETGLEELKRQQREWKGTRPA